MLNEKLNEKLDKLKLPSVKRKAMSVDLNHTPISKPSSKGLTIQRHKFVNCKMATSRLRCIKGKWRC